MNFLKTFKLSNFQTFVKSTFMGIQGLISTEKARRIVGIGVPVVKSNKFNATKVVNDNGKFDSKHEASWAGKLLLLQDTGYIEHLKLDKRELKFSFDVEGVRVGEYTADARFDVLQDFELPTVSGRVILRSGCHYVCDAKSPATRKIRDYPMRRNLMFALHRVEILEL